MPLPVAVRFVEIAEKELDIIFPPLFKKKMMLENGGECSTVNDDWLLYPFFDTSSKQSIRKTCNHIVLENKTAQQWSNFPRSAIAIGHNECGDYLILLPQKENPSALDDTLYVWRHEEGSISHVAEALTELF